MRNTEDDEGGVLDDVGKLGDGNKVLGQLDVRQVPRVLVLRVDKLRQESSARDLQQHKAARVSADRQSSHCEERLFLILTSFSRTHMLTCFSKTSLLDAALMAAIRARAVAHEPEPTQAMRALVLGLKTGADEPPKPAMASILGRLADDPRREPGAELGREPTDEPRRSLTGAGATSSSSSSLPEAEGGPELAGEFADDMLWRPERALSGRCWGRIIGEGGRDDAGEGKVESELPGPSPEGVAPDSCWLLSLSIDSLS